jgi:CRISPR/Cas system-associated exonuclease Cas4 (RecB family)
VDYVISRYAIPPLSRNASVSPDYLLTQAQDVFQRQREFALANKMREPNMSKSKAGDNFASLHDVEYGLEIPQEDFDRVWGDISEALYNFANMHDLLELIASSAKAIAQRPLTFVCSGVKVRMVPDLILFFRREPPMVIDWKVHSQDTRNARTQLAAYAIAVAECEPHSDFPVSQIKFRAQDVGALEVQLLHGHCKQYQLDENDVCSIESYIWKTHTQMELATAGNPKSLTMYDFPVTNYPDNCNRCSFQAICWERESQ